MRAKLETALNVAVKVTRVIDITVTAIRSIVSALDTQNKDS